MPLALLSQNSSLENPHKHVVDMGSLVSHRLEELKHLMRKEIFEFYFSHTLNIQSSGIVHFALLY